MIHGTGLGGLGQTIGAEKNLQGMLRRSLAGRVYANHGEAGDAGNTVANTTTETAFSSSYTVLANTLRVGDCIALYFSGVFSTDTLPTLQFKVKFGSTVLLDSVGTVLGNAITNAPWDITALVIVNAVGASGSVEAQGNGSAKSTAARVSVDMTNTATVAIDDTADRAITLTAKWDIAHASNTVNLRQMLVEILRK